MKLIDTTKISQQTLNDIFSYADKFANESHCDAFKNIVLGNCVSGPNTDIATSFELAFKRMGGDIININTMYSGVQLLAPDKYVLKKMENNSDIIILSHHCKDFLHNYAAGCNKVLVNCGTSNDDSPTQTLIDLYTIRQHFNYETTKINVLFVGNGNDNHSTQALIDILKKYENISIDYLPYYVGEISPDSSVTGYANIDKYDIVYFTRLQNERNDINEPYMLTSSIVNKMKKTGIVLYLSHQNEDVYHSLDKSMQSSHCVQMKHSIYIRMAVLYCLYFKRLDNTFDTLEYNYRAQLQSAIHSW